MNSNAQTLAQGRTCRIGILMPNIYDDYIKWIDAYLSKENYSVIPFLTYDDPQKERECLNALQSRQVDAMICLHYYPENLPVYKSLKNKGLKLIFRGVDVDEQLFDFDTAMIDIGSGFYHLYNHLYDRGCRRIGVVGGYIADEITSWNFGPHCDHFEQALKEHKQQLTSDLAISCGNSMKNAYNAVYSNLKAAPEKFDGFIVQNSCIVLGVYKALYDLGIDVPDRAKICSITEIELCEMLPVPVTVWAQPIKDISKMLAQMALDCLQKTNVDTKRIKFHSTLIQRKSTEG